VMFPTPILGSPLNHTTQSIAGNLDLGPYTLWAGRIQMLPLPNDASMHRARCQHVCARRLLWPQ